MGPYNEIKYGNDSTVLIVVRFEQVTWIRGKQSFNKSVYVLIISQCMC